MAKIIFIWDKIIWEIVHSGKPFSGNWYASLVYFVIKYFYYNVWGGTMYGSVTFCPNYILSVTFCPLHFVRVTFCPGNILSA